MRNCAIIHPLHLELETAPALFMHISAAIAQMEVEIKCGTLSSRHDHVEGAQSHKRDDDALGRDGPVFRQAGSSLNRLTYCVEYVSLPSQARLGILPRPLLQASQPPCKIPTKGRTPSETTRRGKTTPRGSARLSRGSRVTVYGAGGLFQHLAR